MSFIKLEEKQAGFKAEIDESADALLVDYIEFNKLNTYQVNAMKKAFVEEAIKRECGPNKQNKAFYEWREEQGNKPVEVKSRRGRKASNLQTAVA